MSPKRRFGRVRRLPSGRYQVRYLAPDGTDRPAPQTFATKKAAEVWLIMQESEIKRGDWLDPTAGAVPFAKYAANWLDQRQLSPKTAVISVPEVYRLADRARSGHAVRSHVHRKAGPSMPYTVSELRIRGFGAGDGNRTRTISLGIGQIGAVAAADQATQLTGSGRD
jgi:hypothetical protein